ncbi:hypothetical protein CN286_27210 [Bacillus anthracis]|nr:hypothetical protein CN286_27210 [Bacillus anthracis]
MLPEPFYNKISLALFYYTNLQIVFLFFYREYTINNEKMFIITFIPIITNSTIENRTYIWYNRNILYETMYMSLRFLKKGK